VRVSATVSTIIPARNARPFIRTAVWSALAQTYPSIEIIVVDDGSTDGTLAEVEAYGSGITVLRTSNGGPAGARNAAARVARGDWLAFLDADDEWLPEKIEKQMRLANRGVGLVYTDRYNIGARGVFPEIQSDSQAMFEGDVFEDLLIRGNVITTSSVLIRADVFRAAGGFPESSDLVVAEDWDLWIRVAAEHRVRVCREPLVRYRFHQSGASRNHKRMNAARRRVIERALQMPRARRIGAATRRRIWGHTWLTNAWDCQRDQHHWEALAGFARAAACWPFAAAPYREFVKACIGRE
jgi:glycosyltransferase involved in cell wall biosynthesis